MSFIEKVQDKNKNKNKMVLAEGTTPEDLKAYIEDRMLEASPEGNPRKKGRKNGATYTMPYGLAPLEEMGMRINPSTGRVEDDSKTSRDVAIVILEEIYNHGRVTIDELIKRYRGYDPMLLQIVVNLMINQLYLKKYYERKEKIHTLEVMTDMERNKKLGLTTTTTTSISGELDSKNTESP